MKSHRIILICLMLVILSFQFQVFADDKLPIEFERLSERVLIVTAGKVYTDQVIAIAAQKGLIVIDTGKAPSLTAKYRKVIEREFGRNDFIYVINTHYHFDHTSGNQVFADAVIIAHDRSPEGMRQFNSERQNFVLTRRTQSIPQWESQLEPLDPVSEAAQRLRDIIASNRIMCDDYENNYILTLPTLTFSDRMTLDLGDLTLKLVYFGEGRHTGDDIIIHCPEEKLLFTGDLFYKGSMQIAYGHEFDAPRWIEVMNDLFQDENQIELVFDTHNGRMKGRFLILWRDYFVDLWNGLNQAKEEGLEFEAVQDHFSYEKKFTYLEQSGLPPTQLRREHQASLRFVWHRIMGLQSAASFLQQIISGSGIQSVIEKYHEMRSKQKDKYYFDEGEFNTLGYRLMGNSRISEAIEIFKLNVEAYPDSWNVYDSLAEAYMNDGQKELAVKHYNKSLELNPENNNAIEMLQRINEMK